MLGDEPCIQPGRGGKAKRQPKYIDVDLVQDVEKVSASDIDIRSDSDVDVGEHILSGGDGAGVEPQAAP